ncbi:MAG TPA: hypothetical protein PL037_09360, partial [Elusimicrobiales bacterium]|nr:hypothetical protein [Elusimicrobiales bacterium]
QRLPFSICKLPGVHSFTGYFENARDPGVGYYQRRGHGVWTVSKSVPLRRSLTLTPSASYDQGLYISTRAASAEKWVGRYSFSTSMRYDRLWGSLDTGYSYQARMAENRLGKDRLAADRGEEVESVYSQLFVSPVSNTYFRTGASYDMRDGMGGSFSRRLSTMTFEYYHAPRRNLDIYLQDSYRFGDGNKSFVAQVYSGDEKTYLGAGFAYYTTTPGSYVLNNVAGFTVPWAPSWRAEGVLRYELGDFSSRDNKKLKFFEKGLILYKDFHDFHTSWFFKERRGVNELFFLVTLKMNDPAKRDAFDDGSRNDWHPWRKAGAIRDY